MYENSPTVVAFRGAKQAALYCDHVIPLELAELIPVRGSGEPDMFRILQLLLPGSLVKPDSPRSVHPGIIKFVSMYIVAFPQVLGIEQLPEGETFDQRAQQYLPQLQLQVADLLSSISEPVGGVFGLDPVAKSSNQTDDVSLQIAGLNLIDAEKISWEHLLEFRNDAESRRRLRNLRLFFHEKFDGKPKNYIEDALRSAIEKHDETVKKWKFETRAAGLETVFSSKSLALFGVSAVSTVFFGTPIVAAAALAATVEVGAVSLKILMKQRGLAEFRRFDPVSYLIDARGLPRI
jgi:hypothetical protein